ncbi:hypothetical protein CJF30_00009454 [Rutstroemia sp. NJR-2017a BBW]|nr:hypothetical protein CJF30_00009454 [Rutstroemia sp. NJR-2017a BBW]
MSNFEGIIEKACRDREIPGAVLAASDSSAFGSRSLKDPSITDPMPIDGVMWMASCTKLLTTIAAMQCVEKGQLNLDSDVCDVLPELKGLQILTGFEEDSEKPILIDNHKTITLSSVPPDANQGKASTHSYLWTVVRCIQYRAATNNTPTSPAGSDAMVKERCLAPLLFSPGDSWEYSVGIDWAGQMVERVNNNMSLEDYIHKKICEPLNMRNFSFQPAHHPEMMSRLVDMSQRDGGMTDYGTTANPEGKAVHQPKVLWNTDMKDCHGGGGGFGTPCEYLKCLQSICSNDGRLLKPSTVDEMFKPQLSEASREGLMKRLSIPEVNQCLGAFPPDTKVDWGLGGILNVEDVDSRSKSSMAWGGFPNLHWWIDQKAGLCGIWGSQLNPPGDPKINGLFHLFQEEMYKRANVSRGKL